MGKVYSLLSRPIRTFNIENRAERIISREKPIPAPQHSSVEKQKEMVDQSSPNFMQHHYIKDPKLHDHLKDVFVSSTNYGGQQQNQWIISSRALPQNESQHLSDNVDFNKPRQFIRGKCSFSDVLQFITIYQENPTKNSIDVISQQFQLDKQVIQNIVTNFKIFHCMDTEQGRLKAGEEKK